MAPFLTMSAVMVDPLNCSESATIRLSVSSEGESSRLRLQKGFCYIWADWSHNRLKSGMLARVTRDNKRGMMQLLSKVQRLEMID